MFENTYFGIPYQRKLKGHWDMTCPDTGSDKYDACNTVCLIHMMCRCKHGDNLVTIESTIQDCNDGAMVAHVQG
jgi:hypothetical protein